MIMITIMIIMIMIMIMIMMIMIMIMIIMKMIMIMMIMIMIAAITAAINEKVKRLQQLCKYDVEEAGTPAYRPKYTIIITDGLFHRLFLRLSSRLF